MIQIKPFITIVIINTIVINSGPKCPSDFGPLASRSRVDYLSGSMIGSSIYMAYFDASTGKVIMMIMLLLLLRLLLLLLLLLLL
jgi:hypothetical protein